MIAQLNTIAQIWWQWMASMFWQVSLLIILITALDMTIRRWAWPQVRYVLWVLVFLKLIIPPTWQMPTSIVSRIQPQVEEQISIQIGVADWNETNSILSDLGERSQNKGKVPAMTMQTKVAWQTFALSGWIAGVFIFSLILVRKMSRFRNSHQVQGNGKTPEWFHELMVKTAQRLKLKNAPSIIFSKDVKSPAVYGVFKPVLLLPLGSFDQLSREQAEHVLIHELCHFKRGDVLVQWLCIILQIVYWFNPLLIWTRRQMRYICEICCDLSVANILREKTFEYRDTLISYARELFPETMEPGLGFLGILEGPYRLVPRLKWLEKKPWEKGERRIAATICTSLVMMACVMPMAGLSQTAPYNTTLMAQSVTKPVESSNQHQQYEAQLASEKVQDEQHYIETGQEALGLMINERLEQEKGGEFKLPRASTKAIKTHEEPLKLASNKKKVNPSENEIHTLDTTEPEQSIEPSEAVQQRQDPSIDYTSRGLSHLQKEQIDDAISAFDKAIELNPGNSVAYFSRGKAYYRQGKIENAISDYNRAIEISPKFTAAYQNRGYAYYAIDNYEKAISDYDKAIALNPEDAATYNMRGIAYFKQGKTDSAISDYNKAIHINPEFAAAYQNRGYVYHLKNEYRKALSDYDKAIEFNPKNADVYIYRGHIYHSERMYKKAISDYDKAIELDPENANVHFCQGLIYSSEGKFRRARSEFDKVIALNPKAAIAKVAKQYRNRALYALSMSKDFYLRDRSGVNSRLGGWADAQTFANSVANQVGPPWPDYRP